MIHDFRRGSAARYFSSLLAIEYDFDAQEFTLSRDKLEQDHIGYFKKSKKNGLVRLGIFLPEYSDMKYSANPALHIFHCSTTDEKGTRMKVTNSARNSFWSRDQKKDITVELEICKLCAKHLRHEYKINMGTNTFNNFILGLEESRRTKQTLTDSYGYILNWRQVSFCYRDFKRFTCEKCRFSATTSFEQKFLHTHHINGIKTDNHRGNLQCLCVKCHANVDDYHRSKFSLDGLSLVLEFENHIQNNN